MIAGQRPVLELALATLLSGGHLLLEDRPGVGKTVLAKALGRVLGIPTGRIQGTPYLLPTDVTGVHVFQPHAGTWEFRPGPVFTSLLLVDTGVYIGEDTAGRTVELVTLTDGLAWRLLDLPGEPPAEVLAP